MGEVKAIVLVGGMHFTFTVTACVRERSFEPDLCYLKSTHIRCGNRLQRVHILHIHIYISIYIYVDMYVCTYVHISMHASIYIYVCMYAQ